jgi:hypothetical protein
MKEEPERLLPIELWISQDCFAAWFCLRTLAHSDPYCPRVVNGADEDFDEGRETAAAAAAAAAAASLRHAQRHNSGDCALGL